jgi:hypothetical protein
MSVSGPYHRWVFGLLLALGVGYALLALLMSWSSCRGLGGRMASGLTGEGLLEIRVGMTEKNVISLIGPPLKKTIAWKESSSTIWSWTYAEPGLVETGIDVGVAFRDGRVIRAAAEIHDLGVYLCTEKGCPSILREDGLSCLPKR